MFHQQELARSKPLTLAYFREVARNAQPQQTFLKPDPIDPRYIVPSRGVVVVPAAQRRLPALIAPARAARPRLPALFAPARWNSEVREAFRGVAQGTLIAAPMLLAAFTQHFECVLPLILIVGGTALAGAATERLKEVMMWGAIVAALLVVALSIDNIIAILEGLNRLLRDWTTYRCIAGLALVFLTVHFLDRVGFFKESAPAQPQGDPRGYGRYAIADFVEQGTYGDADLAAKQGLHMAISRRGNQDLRFAPKFRE